MATADIIDSDICMTDGSEVLVTIEDTRTIGVNIVDRDNAAAFRVLHLTPDAAHELGNKLRLAAKKARQ